MPGVKGSFYGRVRRLAFALWRGPDYIHNPSDDADFLSGFCILRLAIRKEAAERPLIEARAVYASLANEEQNSAVLRAIYWDSRTIPQRRDIPLKSPLIKIPAKFVQIPVAHLHQWVSAFDTIQTSIQASSHQDKNLPICSLRIEIEPVDSVFEKVWQVVADENNELNRVWQDIWQQMGQALQTYPPITGLEESFPSTEPEPDAYDLQAYTPSLTLP